MEVTEKIRFEELENKKVEQDKLQKEEIDQIKHKENDDNDEGNTHEQQPSIQVEKQLVQQT